MSGASKVALVTRAGSDLGRAIAVRLAADGIAVALTDRDHAAVQATAEACSGGRTAVLEWPTSGTSERGHAGPEAAAFTDVVRAAEAALGQVDLAVNVAGSSRPTPVHRVSDGAYDLTLATNLDEVFGFLRAEVAAMIRSGAGAIVNVTNAAGLHPAPGLATFSAATQGIVALGASTALEVAPRGVRVNTVASSATVTGGVVAMNERERADYATEIPLRRLGEPAEVAAVVAFLLSDEAGFITGQVLSADGGSGLR